MKESYATIRQRAIEKLGSKCVSCGETNPLVLEIDHKENDGKWDRQVRNVFRIVKDIASGIGLDSFQLLCANCHRLKHLLSPVVPEINRETHIGIAWKGTRGKKPRKERTFTRPKEVPPDFECKLKSPKAIQKEYQTHLEIQEFLTTVNKVNNTELPKN